MLLTLGARLLIARGVMVRLHDLLAQLLLPLVYVGVEFVPVFSNRELLVVVDRDVNLSCADWLVIGVVELSYVWMPESLLCTQAFVRVELQQVSQHIQCVVWRSWEHVSEALGLRRR